MINKMYYVASWSGGKDSTASVILAHEHNEPLNLIIFSEVMFDKNISGELPEHIDFIKNKCIPLFKSWGYEVRILHSDRTYCDMFNTKVSRSKISERNGKKYGFPLAMKCYVNSRCKMNPIRDFWKSVDYEFVQYVGIAIDEPERLERIVKTENHISLLQKYRYTEQMAFDLCKKYDLLSPIYEFATRNGCWFCPNARDCELRHLRNNHRDLWDKLLKLEEAPNLIGNIWNSLTQTSIHDKEEQFMWEERQITVFDYLKTIETYTGGHGGMHGN